MQLREYSTTWEPNRGPEYTTRLSPTLDRHVFKTLSRFAPQSLCDIDSILPFRGDASLPINLKAEMDDVSIVPLEVFPPPLLAATPAFEMVPVVRVRTDFDKAALAFAVAYHGRMKFVGEEGGRTGGAAHSDSEAATSPNTPLVRSPANLSSSPWQLWWATVQQVRSAFGAEGASLRLKDDQLINHFPNHYELVRKDLMYKNIKRYIREQGGVLGSSTATTQSSSHFSAGVLSVANPLTGLRLIDCVPVTYSLPADFPLFVEEHKRLSSGSSQPPTWIVKPTNRSQGKGIFLIHRTSQITQWLRERNEEDDNSPFIVSRYVARPYLIANRKFDLRLYVLVLSFKPLVAYWHEKGFARFCGATYAEPRFGDGDEELGAHLTNVALQKLEDGYNASHGGKWSLENMWLHISSTQGSDRAASVLSDIHFLIVHSLRAVQAAILNDKHCFELYGYDVLLDDDLRPHLIEINSSPSLTVTTSTDRHVKQEVLLDTFRLVVPPQPPSSQDGCPVPHSEYRRQPGLQAPNRGGFHLLTAA